MRPSWDEYFLNIAETVSQRSEDPKTQVGAVLVNERKKIISSGYNGYSAGISMEMKNEMALNKHLFVQHAEGNALISCETSTVNSTIYCTWSPCCHCSSMIVNAGVKRVVFKRKYKDFEKASQILDACGVLVHCVE